jgi:hypothetical protein
VIGGAESSGEGVGDTMTLVADDVQSLVVPGTGHWAAEQAPEELLAALTAFLAPTGTDRPRPRTQGACCRGLTPAGGSAITTSAKANTSSRKW